MHPLYKGGKTEFMRYDVDHKERTRLRLLTDAAIMLREDGPDGISVAALMKRQGLTHGGFYAHFESKDDLIACAIDVMFERYSERFRLRTQGLSPLHGLLAYVAYYLSPSHYNRPGQGCPIPSVGGDVARLGSEARKRFEAGVAGMQALIAGQFAGLGFEPEDAQARAVVLMGELAGAVMMARAVKTAAMQKQICHATHAAVLARLGATEPAFEAGTWIEIPAEEDAATAAASRL